MKDNRPTTQFSKQERREMWREERRRVEVSAVCVGRYKRMVKWILVIAVIAGGISLFVWYAVTRPSLPPVTIDGHIEENPPAHLTDKPISDAIQRHMLEHADGKGKSGVIIQYNCKKFTCEPDLIQKLTDLVKQYPDNVYLAPNDYDGIVILTKLGKLKVLDGFNEQVIKDFIER